MRLPNYEDNVSNFGNLTGTRATCLLSFRREAQKDTQLGLLKKLKAKPTSVFSPV
ncbi:MAG TPA: hypothetical protein PKY82_00120 [Pyrinomonadaceae bacterium]|nr:hypothetical protein [Pyrinomonadaceae bacterium]